jgi:hypothetical protein
MQIWRIRKAVSSGILPRVLIALERIQNTLVMVIDDFLDGSIEPH